MTKLVLRSLLFRSLILIAVGGSVSDAFSQMPRDDVAGAEAAILAVMDAQVEAWNDGDIRGFMDGYAHTDSLLFLSGGEAREGWEQAHDAYVRNYPDREAMGTLSFSDLSVRILSESYALVHGRWHLERENDSPGGLFTLLFQKQGRDWKIVHDHTSSE